MNNKFSYEFWLGFIIWTISFFIPYIISSDASYIRIHDTLEGELVWLKLLAESGHMYSLSNDIKMSKIMDGLPRNVLPSGFSMVANICYLFGMIKGYIIAQYIFKTIGYFSFYLFVKKYLILNRLNELSKVSISILITTIQFFTPFGLSVVGMPLLAYGFARLYYHEKGRLTYIIFFVFPFCSSFVWSGIEMIILFNVYLVWLFFKKHVNIKSWIYSWFSFVLGTILANIQFVYGTLFLENFRSHRIVYNNFVEIPNFWDTISTMMGFMFSTHYHISIFISILIFVVFLIAYYGFEKNKWSKKIFIAIIIISIWQAFYPFIEFYLSSITFIKSFRFNRFAFLLPFLWLLILIISLDTISTSKKLRKLIPFIFICQFFILFFSNDETAHNLKRLISKDNFPSYKEYLAYNEFEEIKKIIQPNDTNFVLSIGMSPTISQFHGYSTLDGLFSVYNYDYKLKFRKIFEKELEKSDWKKREYFDNWGNRCYVFPQELKLENVANCQSRRDKLKIKNLEINTQQISLMGGKFIFSACEILNYKSLNLNFIKKIGDSKSSFWVIYIYKVEKLNLR